MSRLRSRVDRRIWKTLSSDLNPKQRARLLELLDIRSSTDTYTKLERLRMSPVTSSSKSISREVQRLIEVRGYLFPWKFKKNVPIVRIKQLSRYAATVKVSALRRMPKTKQLAALRALIASLEASIQDDILIIFETVVKSIQAEADRCYQSSRQRSLKDMDAAALNLALLGEVILDDSLPEQALRDIIFSKLSPQRIAAAVETVTTLTRPHDTVYFKELDSRYRTLRLFLPRLLSNITFKGNASAQPTLEALSWIAENMVKRKIKEPGPSQSISKRWQKLVYGVNGEEFNFHAYTFCTVDNLLTSIKRRDVFIEPSWRFSDPQKKLLMGSEWQQSKPMVCRSLGLSSEPGPTINSLVNELHDTFQYVAKRFSENPDICIEDGRLKLSPLEKQEEPDSLLTLRQLIAERIPRVELPELILEVAEKTRFTEALTHLSEKSARAEDIHVSLCAVLMAEACNTGFEPLIQSEVRALKRDRLAWVSQNYIRDETITKANEMLVEAYNKLPIVKLWGDGTIAAADGIRFIVPVKTIHAGPNPRFFGQGRGLTWYNMLSDKLAGLNDIPVAGTLKDSMSLLLIVLEQQTEIQPSEIMTDTGAYSDMMFGLFRLFGYRFSPRLADIGGQRLWRVDTEADYGVFNSLPLHKIQLKKVYPHWEEILRLIGSLQLGKLPANEAMRTLQTGKNQTALAKAIAEIGRIDKTIHLLTYIDNAEKRRMILKQLNRVEGRHNLAREVFHGRRGELRQKYREGQEDQLGALGLVLNIIVYWNALYIQRVIDQLKSEGFIDNDDDIAHVLPFIFKHINMNGKYNFDVSEEVKEGKLRPLRDADDDQENSLS